MVTGVENSPVILSCRELVIKWSELPGKVVSSLSLEVCKWRWFFLFAWKAFSGFKLCGFQDRVVEGSISFSLFLSSPSPLVHCTQPPFCEEVQLAHAERWLGKPTLPIKHVSEWTFRWFQTLVFGSFSWGFRYHGAKTNGSHCAPQEFLVHGSRQS